MTDIKETIKKYDKNFKQYSDTFEEIKNNIIKWNNVIEHKNKKGIPTKDEFTSAIEKIENIRKNINEMYEEYVKHLTRYSQHHDTLYKNNENRAKQAAKNLELYIPPKSTAFLTIMNLKQNLLADQLQILKNNVYDDYKPNKIAESYLGTLNIKYSDKFKDSLKKLDFFNAPGKTRKDFDDKQLKTIIDTIVEIINENIKPFDEEYEKYNKFNPDFETFKEPNFIKRYETLKKKIELEYKQLTPKINVIKAYFKVKPLELEEETSSETIVELFDVESDDEGEEQEEQKQEQKRERSIWDWVLLIFLVIVVAIGLITIIGIFIAFIYAVLDERRRYKKTGEWALGRVVLNSLFNWYYIYKYWMTYGII